MIGLSSAVFVLFGQNIGTCITAVLASIGTSRSAKRATIIHLMFNMIGTVIFTFLFIMFPIAHVIDGQIPVAGLSGILPSTPAGQIAMVHTLSLIHISKRKNRLYGRVCYRLRL